MTGWACQWKPFWIPVGDTFQKAYPEEWQLVDDGSICDPGEYSVRAVPYVADSMRQRRAENSDCAIKYERPLVVPSASKPSWQVVGQPDAPTWKLSGTQGTSAFWENSEAPLPHPMRRCNFIHSKQLSPFPERLELPYPNREILSGCEEDVSFIHDRFSTWVKADPNNTSERHMDDVRKAFADFVRHLCEGKRHPLKNMSSTAACQTVHPFKKS